MASVSLHPPLTLRYTDESRSLLIRPARVGDEVPVMEAVDESLAELRAFMPWAHFENTVEQQRARLETIETDHREGRDVIYHVFDGDGERLLGCTGLHFRSLNPRGLEIGYWIRTSAAGQGIATRISQCFCVFVFAYLGYDRFQCAYNEANVGSHRVNDKVGFREEGRHRNFEASPTDEMRANGCLMAPITISTALVPEDIPGLAWYATIQAALRVETSDGDLVTP